MPREPVFSRRALLQAALASLLPVPALALSSEPVSIEPARLAEPASLFISGARSGARSGVDEYVAVVFDDQAKIVASVPIGARAHGAASHLQSQRACLFARRPGMFMNTFDRRTPGVHAVTEPVGGRHFYGHGAYSQNGKLLFATENDFDGMRGVLGIYDASRHYERIGELDTAGVGPHEVLRVPGTSLLLVANGGIHTHPDSGRDKLNIETMEPNLALIDSRDGKLLARHVLPAELHQVSIRHLACADDGVVWFAAQYEGEEVAIAGLAGSISIEQSMQSFHAGVSGKGLTLVEVPAALQARMTHYVSSVAVAGDYALFTSSKGGVVFQVNRRTSQIDETISIRDCSGVTPRLVSGLDGALVTSGTGEIVRLDAEGMTSLAMHTLQWDNHVYPI
ncbi:DUF1513 domain-containing protein [Granulosicoccus antarcticus]|uniref:DUF1513 domain-containing protein n=1 Tax=Granulosicoccus antarcticus IMCC3135 TaxID=1192854 RepID=A0A2Z2P9E6_9GAMM|nr:DUF1513 domain-containing protein [Granulosicoccus antarcticus]ASJ76514.1 hypothetical protein IMCC3135_32345 [Granulosicoccus antarcticus IMCC3135]